MESTYSLKKFIEQHLHTKEMLPFPVSKIQVSKGYSLIKKGEVESKLHFVCSGIIESTTDDVEREDHIIGFNFPNQITCSLSSIITKEPTEFDMTCMTNCKLEVIQLADLEDAIHKGSALAINLMKYVTEYYYLVRLKKQKDLLLKDSQERYLDLLNEEPEIAKYISIKKIASYLGVHPKTISKFRKMK